METGHPSTRAVDSGSGNRALGLRYVSKQLTCIIHTRHERRELVDGFEAGGVEDTAGLKREAKLRTIAAVTSQRGGRRLVRVPTEPLRRATSQPGHLQVVAFRPSRAADRKQRTPYLACLRHVLDKSAN